MSLFKSSSATPLAPLEAWWRRRIARLVPFALSHLLACAIAVWSEAGTGRIVMFLAAWGLRNFFWLVLLRRPGPSAGLSLTMSIGAAESSTVVPATPRHAGSTVF